MAFRRKASTLRKNSVTIQSLRAMNIKVPGRMHSLKAPNKRSDERKSRSMKKSSKSSQMSMRDMTRGKSQVAMSGVGGGGGRGGTKHNPHVEFIEKEYHSVYQDWVTRAKKNKPHQTIIKEDKKWLKSLKSGAMDHMFQAKLCEQHFKRNFDNREYPVQTFLKKFAKYFGGMVSHMCGQMFVKIDKPLKDYKEATDLIITQMVKDYGQHHGMKNKLENFHFPLNVMRQEINAFLFKFNGQDIMRLLKTHYCTNNDEMKFLKLREFLFIENIGLGDVQLTLPDTSLPYQAAIDNLSTLTKQRFDVWKITNVIEKTFDIIFEEIDKKKAGLQVRDVDISLIIAYCLLNCNVFKISAWMHYLRVFMGRSQKSMITLLFIHISDWLRTHCEVKLTEEKEEEIKTDVSEHTGKVMSFEEKEKFDREKRVKEKLRRRYEEKERKSKEAEEAVRQAENKLLGIDDGGGEEKTEPIIEEEEVEEEEDVEVLFKKEVDDDDGGDQEKLKEQQKQEELEKKEEEEKKREEKAAAEEEEAKKEESNKAVKSALDGLDLDLSEFGLTSEDLAQYGVGTSSSSSSTTASTTTPKETKIDTSSSSSTTTPKETKEEGESAAALKEEMEKMKKEYDLKLMEKELFIKNLYAKSKKQNVEFQSIIKQNMTLKKNFIELKDRYMKTVTMAKQLKENVRVLREQLASAAEKIKNSNNSDKGGGGGGDSEETEKLKNNLKKAIAKIMELRVRNKKMKKMIEALEAQKSV